jgi:hypothetical protein
MVMPRRAERIGVHHPLDHVLIGAEDAAWCNIASTSVVLPWSTWR